MLFETKIWGPLFLTGHAQCSQLVAIPSLFSANRLEGENVFILCVPSCVHTRIDIHIYTYFYLYLCMLKCIHLHPYLQFQSHQGYKSSFLPFSIFPPHQKTRNLACSGLILSVTQTVKNPSTLSPVAGGAMLILPGALTFLPGCSVSMPSSSCSILTTPHPRPPSLTPSSPYLDSNIPLATPPWWCCP